MSYLNNNLLVDRSFVRSSTTISNSSVAYVYANILTTPELQGGTYKISLNYIWSSDISVTNHKARLKVDGVQEWESSQCAAGGSPDKSSKSYSIIIMLTPGSHTITMEFASSIAGNLVHIYDRAISIERWG